MFCGFDVVLSRVVSAREVEEVVADLLPGSAMVVTPGIEYTPDDPAAAWVVLTTTDDPDWPCVIQVLTLPDGDPLGEYPDITLCEHLCPRLDVKGLCGSSDLVPGLDPQDPYWSLVWDGGSWYLADTWGSRLMGPYTDGTKRYPGDQPVRLKYKVDLAGRNGSPSE